MPSGLLYPCKLDKWGFILFLIVFTEFPVFKANSVGHKDHMPYSAASDLGVHYLPRSLLG